MCAVRVCLQHEKGLRECQCVDIWIIRECKASNTLFWKDYGKPDDVFSYRMCVFVCVDDCVVLSKTVQCTVFTLVVVGIRFVISYTHDGQVHFYPYIQFSTYIKYKCAAIITYWLHEYGPSIVNAIDMSVIYFSFHKFILFHFFFIVFYGITIEPIASNCTNIHSSRMKRSIRKRWLDVKRRGGEDKAKHDLKKIYILYFHKI